MRAGESLANGHERALPIATATVAPGENLAEERNLLDMTADDLFRAIEDHGKDGVDFVTVHCGVTAESVKRFKNEGRILDIVSRGGSIHAKMIEYHGEDNPLYTQYDRLLEIAREYDMTISLGDGLRPGCLADASDRAQVQETIILGELAKRARDADVQVMVEGPGHMPMDQIAANMKLQKRLCNNAPFYVLGPLVTDVAPGYDHITAAIGGAIAGSAGADFLCYVTPAEHLRLPDLEDVRNRESSPQESPLMQLISHVVSRMRKIGIMIWPERARIWTGQNSVTLPWIADDGQTQTRRD